MDSSHMQKPQNAPVSAAAIAALTTAFTARGGLPRLAGSPDTQRRDSVVSLEALTQQIIDLVEKDVDADDLTADSSLQSEGLDSLEVMSLVFRIEEHYDIVLDEEDADDLRTVGDLAALVVRRLEQQP